MTTFLMAGVVHNMKGGLRSQGLMDADSEQNFAKLVTPRLTSNSLILFEGYSHTQFLRPGTVEYEKRTAEFIHLFPLEGNRPRVGFVDPRYSPLAKEQQSRIGALIEWMRLTQQVISMEDRSVTPPEYEESVRNRTYQYEQTRDLTSPEIELARRVHMQTKRFNRSHIEAMQRAERNNYDLCVVVCGDNHALSLSIKTGYPYLSLAGVEDARAFLGGYITTQVFPEVAVNRNGKM